PRSRVSGPGSWNCPELVKPLTGSGHRIPSGRSRVHALTRTHMAGHSTLQRRPSISIEERTSPSTQIRTPSRMGQLPNQELTRSRERKEDHTARIRVREEESGRDQV